ncbi:epoxide hydrolase [Mesorhizobium muleiense]|uniref:epoxide hydrolase family protein n=1 Tax=Mesorhizobium muleiense TaxID=1004279 RepID=UPI002E3172EB|nr:epoxide hydrolase [Mesorhizobium muleiense]
MSQKSRSELTRHFVGNLSRRQAILSGVAAAAMSTLGVGIARAQVASATTVAPFRVAIPQVALDDLKRRLDGTRWPEHETESGWAQGVPLVRMQSLVEYWRTEYDWRRCEARINAFPQFRAEIDGLRIHFLHVRSRHEDALPIILTHGWPGSVIEFLKVIGPLTDPIAHGGRAEDAFHVVVPSLPGYGFSDKPAESGWHVGRIARASATLAGLLREEIWAPSSATCWRCNNRLAS